MRILTLAALLACASCAGPVVYDDVAGRPREERLAALGRATDDERAAIYREHLARVAAGPKVTADERAGLARLVALAVKRRDGADEREADQLLRGMREETIRAVVALGGEGP